MPSIGRMCYLTTVLGSFHGRVLAARLGAEGVLVVLRGATDGVYPIQGTVDVLVPADQLKLAREILLADAVEDAFGGFDVETLGDVEALRDVGELEETNGRWSSDAAETSLMPHGSGDLDGPLGAGNRSEGFYRRSTDTPPRPRYRARIHGAPAVLVVVVVVMLMAVGVVAAAVH